MSAKKNNSKWTLFSDMHSGGGAKEKQDKIYIEAPQAEAEVIFYNRFGHSPHRVSCTCCGSDYSISEDASLAQLSGYHRHCEHDKKTNAFIEADDTSLLKYGAKEPTKHIPLKEYVKLPTVLVIYAKDIKPDERIGSVPRQGYVWQD